MWGSKGAIDDKSLPEASQGNVRLHAVAVRIFSPPRSPFLACQWVLEARWYEDGWLAVLCRWGHLGPFAPQTGGNPGTF